ncbi:MAG: glycosyltransferase family protein [Candidatus Margulisbacteria bacterium]|nr:glycosyltransferase family protein [Candidatus Margulisiibacteriota bacterium]MBU1617125.1 glycosyltransferase family protein [Candidatus Margulisiibacteriota bacterium]
MIGIIIQARMGSTRLQGKVMKEVLGRPLLELLIERLKNCQLVDEIVVATTTKAADDVIEALARKLSVKVMRGSEDDVLDRYFQAAKKFALDHIVRITADCPLSDPEIVDKMIKYYIDSYFKYDYLCNTIKPTFPDGMDVEIFSFEVLEKIHRLSQKKYLREHVCGYIIENPDQFRIKNYANDNDLSAIRLTVDTPEDFELIRVIFERLYPSKGIFHFDDILELIRENPELSKMNSRDGRNEGFLLSLEKEGYDEAERAAIKKIIVDKEKIYGI